MTVFEKDLDLNFYLTEILKHWWIILLFTASLAGSVYLYAMLQPDQYAATATILVSRSRPTLALAEQFPNVNEPVDARSRLDSMVTIAKSDAVASEVLALMKDEGLWNGDDLHTLKNKVNITGSGDLILIEAKSGDARLAETLANTWAGVSVRRINLAYSGENPLREFEGQIVQAQAEYQAAQASLEAFLQENQIALLENQIHELELVLKNLAESRADRIRFYDTRRQEMESLRVQAEALLEQLRSGSRSQAGGLGDALATLIARTSALGLTTQLTFDMQLNELTNLADSAPDFAADLEALIGQLEHEEALAGEKLDQLIGEITAEEGFDQIASLAARLQEYRARLEQQQGEERELTGQRHTTWAAYQALLQKATEIKNAAQTYSQVTIASEAILPSRPVSKGLLRNAGVAGLLGVTIGILAVIARQWWRTNVAGQ